MATDVLSQVIDPPLGPDEAATVTVTATGLAASPAAWACAFVMFRDPGEAPLTLALAAPAVTGSGPYTAVWTVALTAAQAAARKPGLNTWEVRRTDAGSEERLAGGTWLVLAN